jgi:S1-C subfamily serine protease
LALLKANFQPSKIAYFRAKGSVRSGNDIIALGFPLHGLLGSQLKVSTGIVSATVGLLDDISQLQISAPIQPGNSGGPLLDEYGNVAGVVVAKLRALAVAKATGDIPQNVNFAVKD